MNLEGIIAISGKPGLFKIIGQTKNGVVVESLLNANRLAMSSSSKMSALQDIAIYTYTEEIPLVEVLDMIRVKESGKIFMNILNNKGTNAQNNVVLVNSGIAISTVLGCSIEDGIEKARESLRSRSAINTFKTLKNLSN